MGALTTIVEQQVIEYCLEILDEVKEKIQGEVSLASLEAALNLQYAERYENKVYQYRWALRHPAVKEAITRARIVLPDGFEYKEAEMGNTVYCRVGAGEGPAFELKKHLWPIKCL